MKITKVEAIPVRVPLARPNSTATGVITETRKVIVKIITDSGIAGFGEASSVPEYGGGTADSIMDAITAYRPYLIGADPSEMSVIAGRLAETAVDDQLARAAVDVALYDIVARNLDQPIHVLFGDQVRDSVEVFLIIAGDGPEEVADNARQAVADGYRVVKVKAGFEPITATIAKIDAIRAAVGFGLDITVDANQAWQVDEAIANINQMAPFDLQSVEQPVAARDIKGMAAVTSTVDVPIIADESVWDIDDARHVIENRGADVLSVRVGKAGGLSAARSILDAAHGAGMPCILGSMLETDLGITAALQMAASVECALHACALSHYAMYDASFLEQPLRQDGGTLYVPTGPGLGVTVSEQRIDQFRESP